jgi:N-acetylglucosaminyldiphosphoundecaprenol N-acetyl-beta-D-mannosaminyltransferase
MTTDAHELHGQPWLQPHRTFAFGGLNMAQISIDDAADWVLRQALAELSSVVVTSHLNHVMLAERDPGFREAVSAAELNVADGWPLVFASRLIGPRLPGRVIGIDLVDTVLRREARLRLAILGGPPGSAEALAERERERHDIVQVEPMPAGVWDTPEEHAAILDRVREARPNLVLIGLGAPRQELFAEELRPVVRGPILCCGATIPVLGGHVRRAPSVVRSVGMEWAFRTAQSPARLGPRYVRSAWWYARVFGGELTGRAARRRTRSAADA